MAKLTEQIEQIERVTKSADENNRIYNEIESNIDSLIKRRDKMQKQAEKLKMKKLRISAGYVNNLSIMRHAKQRRQKSNSEWISSKKNMPL
ncbi:hypothetical protein P7H21_23905 [Paenibacillus larvae]|nr:hypothetical protein [Paenibacillus larvae]MDT2306387.1 hypothetical protein [Paenibacillus larvae]